MTDNVRINEGTGRQVAADDIGGVLHQRVKLSIGAEGEATDLAPGRKADALSVPVALSTEDVAALGALGTTLTAILAKVIAAPATEATLAAVLAKVIAAPATEAKQDALTTLLGAVTANPATNTVQGRLKDLLTGIALAGGENHIGAMGGNTAIMPVIFTPDTLALGAGDVAADTQAITNAMRVNAGTGILQSLVLLDKDDQAAAQMDLVFFSANTALGTENSAPSISDSNADNILGIVSIYASDFIDLGGVKVATKTSIGLPVQAASGTRDLYCAIIVRGTPTQTGSGITARFGFLQD